MTLLSELRVAFGHSGFVVASFYGGNDSGSIEEMYRSSGAPEAPSESLTGDSVLLQRLEEMFDEVLYGEFGGFDGDWEVQGELRLDLGTGEITVSYAEKVWSDVSIVRALGFMDEEPA